MRYFIVLGLFLVNYACHKTNHNMLNIGHRGAMGHETENTIASIIKALELGVDMIEIDVFVIKTGEVVVFHDVLLDSLTDAKGKIEEYTFEELRNVKIRGGHQIPTLQEVIETVDRKVPLNIELKGQRTAEPTHRIISEFLERGYATSDFIISSFLWFELTDYRKLDSEMDIAVLTEENPIEALAIAKELKAVAINPWYKNLNRAQVIEIHRQGFDVYAYTVNDPENLQKMKSWEVDGVFCNYPDVFHKTLGK